VHGQGLLVAADVLANLLEIVLKAFDRRGQFQRQHRQMPHAAGDRITLQTEHPQGASSADERHA
jgi:hypothetical protein